MLSLIRLFPRCCRRRRPRFARSLVVVFVAVFALAIAAPPPHTRAAAPGEDVAVVVHPGVSVSSLSLTELRKILLGDRQYWPSNQRITLLILAPEASARTVVLRRVYQMTEAQFRQYWIAKVFRADVASGPKIVGTNQAATQLTAGIPGAISFVNADQVPRGLKVLRIDGRAPGEKGYPLQ